MDLTELVQRAASGDRDAFGELVRRYERLVLGVAWNLLRDYHAAQDIAQNAFVIAFRSLATLKDPAAFGPWVAQIAARCCYQFRKSHPTFPLSVEHEPAAVPSELMLIGEETDRVLTAIQSLPEHERTVVLLRYVDDHDVATIAKITARPVGTVTKQLSRAIKRLQELLIEVEQ